MQTLEPHAAITLLDEVARQLTAGCVDSAMDQLIVGLHHLRAGWSPAEWRHFATVIAREHPLRRLIHEDPLTRRAFDKPRGYPGDAAGIHIHHLAELFVRAGTGVKPFFAVGAGIEQRVASRRHG